MRSSSERRDSRVPAQRRSGGGVHARRKPSSRAAPREGRSPPRHKMFTSCSTRRSEQSAKLVSWRRRTSSQRRSDLAANVRRRSPCRRAREAVFGVDDSSVAYGSALALAGVDLDICQNAITAMIGPSGCGKSTFIRCLNRMNDLVPGVKVGGQDPLPRRRPLRAGRGPGRGSPADRDGLPAAEPVSEVDLRQRRLRACGCSACRETWTSASSRRCAAPRSGTRSRTG